MSVDTTVRSKQGAVIGGWICLAIGTALMFWTMFSFMIYLPLFLASFTLGIVSVVQHRILHGITIILLSVILPFVIGLGIAYYQTHQTLHPIETKSDYSKVSPSVNEGRLIKETPPPLTSTEDTFNNLDSAGLIKRYKNGRFGFSIDYPQTFIAKEPPQNGDGITLTSPDGKAVLVVSGGNNSSGLTKKQYYNMFIKEFNAGLGYRKMGGNWFVITWRDRDKVGYMKMFVGSGSENSFRFIYPVAQKKSYDEVVTRMEKSFRSGDINQAW